MKILSTCFNTTAFRYVFKCLIIKFFTLVFLISVPLIHQLHAKDSLDQIFDMYCMSCHRTKKSSIKFDYILDLQKKDKHLFQNKILELIKSEYMPPSAWHRRNLLNLLTQ
jgi:hypothetical protein